MISHKVCLVSKNCFRLTRRPKRNAIIAEVEGTVRIRFLTIIKKSTNTIFITTAEGEEFDYLIPYGSRIIVKMVT